MKDIKRCCFSGHSAIYNINIYNRVEPIIEKIILEHNVKEFLIGDYGGFYICAAKAVKRLKRVYPDISLGLVVPCLTEAVDDYTEFYHKLYDYILVADMPENTPKNHIISKINEYMVNHSDYMVCCIQHDYLETVAVYDYAKGKNINIINITTQYI